MMNNRKAMDAPARRRNQALPHSSHWGAFSVQVRDPGIEVEDALSISEQVEL
jgi:hypothetical protein